jgi:protease-4
MKNRRRHVSYSRPEVDMLKRWWVVVLGVLVLVLVGTAVALVAVGISASRVPGKVIVSVVLGGPMVEVKAEDPFAELMGDHTVSLRELREALLIAAEDSRVAGVRVRVDGFGGSLATASEVRSLLDRVEQAGKWTAAYFDTAGEFSPGNLQYYVASSCQEVSLNPLGDVNLIGLSMRSPFIYGTLEKLKVEPEFPGRGDYKTARFMYTERDFTPAHREMMTWLLDSMAGIMVADIAENRGLGVDDVERLIDHGPHLGEEAVAARLVDTIEDWGSFTTRLSERSGADATVLPFTEYLRRARTAPAGAKIAVVTAVGAIMRGESRQDLNPLLGGDVMGSDTIARAWRDVRRTKGVKAAIFRVDSPGGSAVASEVIRQEMARTAEEIPVVVSMASVAASGGYWVSCGAQRVVASPATITASIGVFGGHLNMEGFWADKLGVTFGKLDHGANANLYGDLESWTDDQRDIVDRQLDRIYDAFVERVSRARGMEVEAVDAVGQGRVFTGLQASTNGLVDVVGGFDTALSQARELAGIAADDPVQLVDFPRVLPWWQRLAQKGREEEISVRVAAESLREWWQTGSASPPGVVWMPPVYVR